MAQQLARTSLTLRSHPLFSSSSRATAIVYGSSISRLTSPGAPSPRTHLALLHVGSHHLHTGRQLSTSSSSLPSRTSCSTWAARFSRAASTVAPAKVPTAPPAPPAATSAAPEASETEDPDAPPPNSGFRDRLRFLMRRYGWWALTVYLLASLVDFSLCFAAIHLLGAEHIKGLERQVRAWIGMGEREEETTDAVDIAGQEGSDAERGVGVVNNESARQKAILKVHGGSTAAVAEAFKAVEKTPPLPAGAPADELPKRSSSFGGGMISSTLWTEIVLAYTIHKTLLLPFRVFVTAGITPSFVKLMVKWGWSRPNAVVQKAASEAAKRRAAKKAAASAAS